MGGTTAINWDGLLGLVLLASVLGAVPVSLFIRWLYRLRVRAHMRAFSGAEGARQPDAARQPTAPPPPGATLPLPPPPPLSIQTVEADSPHATSEEAAELFRLATRTPRRAAAAYGLAGVAHAAVATAVMFLLQGVEFFPLRTLTVVFALAWPVVPTATAVAVAGRRLKVLAPVLFLAVALLLLLPLGAEYRYVFGVTLLTHTLVPSVLMLLVANRHLRSVAPLVLVFLSVLVFGMMLSAAAFIYVSRLGPGSETAALLMLPCVTALGAVAAAGFVAAAARRYAKKRASDQMVTLNLYWLLYTEWQCLLLASAAGVWAAAGMLAYVAYSVALRLGLRPLRDAAERRGNVGLLLLRVFGSRARSERALEELGLRWRYVGSIKLIVGEDLATASLEPHEFLDFMTGRLAGRFVKGPADLERKIGETDTRPDPDGRFRINEFFCHEDTWRGAMTRLARAGDVVLMDLRGFGRPKRDAPDGTRPAAIRAEEARRGTGVVFELTRLVDVEPIGNVVMAFDKTTDVAYVEEVLRAAWAGMADDSPNRRAPADPVRLLRLGGRGGRDSLRLLSMLCAAARPARRE